MDIELLRTFLEVHQLRHFGAAAEALHLTQAAVSARIKQLESILGVQLFDRSRREIQITPEGYRLLRYADHIIAEWRKARQDVSLGASREQLSIGGSLRLWDVFLQGWLHRLRQTRPGLAVIAESHTPELLTRRLLDGVMDVAVMLEPAQIELVQIKEVARIDLVLVASEPGLDVTQALGERYLMVDWGLAHALEHRRLFPDAPEPVVRVSNGSMALAYIRELGGAAYLPYTTVEADLSAGELFLVAEAPSITRHAYAVYLTRSTKLPLIRSALEAIDPGYAA